MSTNAKRRGDGVEEKEQAEFRNILENLLRNPENKKCADCATAAPRWASASLGVFLCIKCSGLHRSMGTHISFIRSVSLDRWKPEEISFVQAMGNSNAALIWEAKLPAGFRRPSPNDSISLERFIRDKYEHKRYYKPPAVAVNPAVKPETEIAGKIAGSGVLQPPTRLANTGLSVMRPPNPQRTNMSSSVPPKSSTPPVSQKTTIDVDPFLVAVKSEIPTTSNQLPLPFIQPVETSSPSATLFSADFTVPQPTQNVQSKVEATAVDVNLLKKSNIMSMFDVQTEQQKQQQQQQMLLQQQMYFSSPQMYYTTSGGLIPLMYSPQNYGPTNVIYPQHFQ
jgi:stromal membrane-associated protein